MQFLRTNTATRITVGPFLDKTDGITPETGITVTSCKLTMVVDDGGVPTLVLDTAPTASGGANDMVHITGDDAGYYDLELAAANVNYLGRAKLAITDAAVHCPVFMEFMILPAVVYDSFVLGTDVFQVDVTQFGGSNLTSASGIPEVKVASIAANAITATSINADAITAAKVADGTIDAATFAAGAITAAAIATDAIDADALATDAVTEIKNGVWGTTGLSALSRTTAGGILYSAGALSSTNSTVNDAGASTTVFVTALTSAVDDFYNDQTILFTDGDLAGQSRIISDYNGTTKAITVDEALTSAPANGVAFTIYASHTHTTTSVGTAVWASADRQLTALDEDVTTIDLNATTIGTVTTVTNKVTPIDVNGVTFANWAKWVGATTQGKCVVTLISGNDYTFDYFGMDDTTIVWTTTCTLGGRAAPTRS